MSTGILVVESRPASPEELDTFNKWYDDVHLPEMLALAGVASARRFASDDGESFLAVYELSVDIDEAKANLGAALSSGSMSRPEGVQLDPPPSVRFFSSPQ